MRRKRRSDLREKKIEKLRKQEGAVVGKTVILLGKLDKNRKPYYLRYDLAKANIPGKRITEASYKRSASRIIYWRVKQKRIKKIPVEAVVPVKRIYRLLKAYKFVSNRADYSLFTVYAYTYLPYEPTPADEIQVDGYLEEVRNSVVYSSFKRPNKMYTKFRDSFEAADIREVNRDEVPIGVRPGEIHSYILFRRQADFVSDDAVKANVDNARSKYTGSQFGVVRNAGDNRRR